jgi:hypothetical protein
MERRSFLKAGLAVGGVGGTVAEEASAHGLAAVSVPPLPDPALVNQVLRNLDKRMTWIDEQRELPPGLAAPAWAARTPDGLARSEKYGRLFRQSMRTLYMTGQFMDLPDEIKMHPEIQARITAAQPEMDEAVFGTTQMLESLRPEDHRAIQDRLRRNPDIGERLAALLDGTAREDGFPAERRLDVRATTIELARRMTEQSPALTIDPYVQRVRKIEARPHTAEESSRLLAARVGEKVFWEDQRRLAELQARWERRLAQDAPQDSPSPSPLPAPSPKPGKKGVSQGGKIMGFGAASMGAGLIFYGLYKLGVEFLAVPAAVLGITVGPILLLIGLIMLLSS